jgi:hypothetical protein
LSSSAYSVGFAILVLVSCVLQCTSAEYDCSAKDDGWYYDPEFCHIYWRCIHGSSEEFECASGTAWDHHENRCNWLDSVDCSRAEKTTVKALTEDEDDDDGTGTEHDMTDGKANHHPRHHDEDDEDGTNNDDDDEPPVTVASRHKKKKKKKNRTLNSNKRMLDGETNDDINGKDRENSLANVFLFIVLVCMYYLLACLNQLSVSNCILIHYFIY